MPLRRKVWLVVVSVCALVVVLAALKVTRRPADITINPGVPQRAQERADGALTRRDENWQRGDLGYGVTQPIPIDANPHVASVAEAFRTGKYPERTSAMVLPKSFDPVAYKSDPQRYLNTVEPGRVWQIRNPGPAVPRLVPQTPKFTEVEQGEPIVLKTKAIPGAPVTYTSFDLGAFQNRLNSITVAADGEGVARATFTGTPGTIGMVNILAGSPMATSQIHFIVNVHLPRKSTPQTGAQ